MFGTENSIGDITQGPIGDCYFLAGSSAVAEIDERFIKNFVNPDNNQAGIFAFNVWVRGIPTVVAVDDNLPYDADAGELKMSKIGSDGSYWGPLLEKAWAKTVGNYEIAGLGG